MNTENDFNPNQLTLFDFIRPEISIDKPIRLIELFAGYGSQALALEYLGVDFEHYRAVESDKYAIASYNAIHGTDFPVMDVTKIKGDDLGIIRKSEFTYLLTYSFPCFVGETMVLTSDGFKQIRDVCVGDKVITHDNTYREVIASKKTGTEPLYVINGMAFHELKCTKNHKFYARKMVKRMPTNSDGKRYRTREFGRPEYMECCDLDKSYYLGYAINQKEVVPKWDGITFTWKDQRKPRPKNDLQKHLNNYDFWWLIGRYVGDGWHRSQGGIIICCAKNETEEITDIATRLSMSYSIVKERTVNKIHFPSKELELFVEPFGRGAKNKRIPGFVFDLPRRLIKGFLDGYVSADGTFTQGRYKISTVSQELCYGIGQCVAKAYLTPFSIYKTKRKSKSIIEGRTVNQKDSWSVVWKTNKKKQDKAFYEDGFIWFPINNIVKSKEVKDVYDIEVKDNHSFTANGAIVHNCTDLSVAGQMKGMEEGSGTRSSLLWEVRRLLEETKELPQILLMENVTQVHSKKNMPHFQKWLDFLESKGYTSYMQDLNARDYGVAQNRNRTFLISFLGNYNYESPKPIKLKSVMKDYLEDEVEDKYYLTSEKAKKLIDTLILDGKILTKEQRQNTLERTNERTGNS